MWVTPVTWQEVYQCGQGSGPEDLFCMLGLLFEWDTFSHCGCTHVESVDQGFIAFLIMSQLNWENNSRNFSFIHLFLKFFFIYSDNNHLPASAACRTFICHTSINSESSHWHGFRDITEPWTTTDHQYHCIHVPVTMTAKPLVYIQLCIIMANA